MSQASMRRSLVTRLLSVDGPAILTDMREDCSRPCPPFSPHESLKTMGATRAWVGVQ